MAESSAPAPIPSTQSEFSAEVLKNPPKVPAKEIVKETVQEKLARIKAQGAKVMAESEELKRMAGSEMLGNDMVETEMLGSEIIGSEELKRIAGSKQLK